jgi:hypothetical protein
LHGGALVIEGSASSGFTFLHADGTPYGTTLWPAAVDAARLVFLALTNMGFKDGQARALISAAQASGAPAEFKALLYAALRAT